MTSFELLLPPHQLLPHDVFDFTVHLAYRVIFHVVHVGIVVIHVVNCESMNHPLNVYQSFVGFLSIISGVSIVYIHVLFSLFVQPSSS